MMQAQPQPNVPPNVHTVVIPATGEYATIDNKPNLAAMQALMGKDATVRQKQIDAVLAHPDRFAPPVLYALSEALFQTGKKDEAGFWFYAGQLRARFDANRTTDKTAGEGVGVLNERFGPPINKYMFQDVPKLQAVIPRVVDWDRKTPHHYDGRWLAPHGMGAFQSDGKAAPILVPESQWNQIAEATRRSYLDGFLNALTELKKQGKIGTPTPSATKP